MISPLLANLFLHYVFDCWLNGNWPGMPFARYADDAVCHCQSREQAEQLLDALKPRFEACGLQLHPDKTRIVYCKSSRRTEEYPNTSFLAKMRKRSPYLFAHWQVTYTGRMTQ